jgi:hypothetical protein
MDELEKTIRDLVERKNAAREGSAAEQFYCRQLQALRYRYEEAGGIMCRAALQRVHAPQRVDPPPRGPSELGPPGVCPCGSVDGSFQGSLRTGMPRDEILRRGIIRNQIPLYGLGGAVAALSLMELLSPQGGGSSSPNP